MSSIHPTAIVETAALGPDCTVSEYASVGVEASLDAEVNIGSGARITGRVTVGRGATIGPNAVVAQLERSGDGAIAIGRGAVVGPGSVVEADVPAYAVVRGSPARIVGYVDTPPDPTEAEVVDSPAIQAATETGVPGVVLHPLARATDLRGSLAALEFRNLPFQPQRVFAVYDVPSESVRGAHAHRVCAQVLVCVSGEVRSVADDGSSRQEFRLTSPDTGLYIPSMIWSMQYRYSKDAVLVVLAERPYDPDDYIRDYEEFLELVAAH